MHSPVGCVPSTAMAAGGGGLCIPACTEWGCISACTGQEGICWGVSAGGSAGGWGVSATHPLWTEWQMPVKTLPCRNYLADGKYIYVVLPMAKNNVFMFCFCKI